jgi:hypothetical protein
MAAAAAGAIFEIKNVSTGLTDEQLHNRASALEDQSRICEDSPVYLSFLATGTIWPAARCAIAFFRGRIEGPATPADKMQGFSLTLRFYLTLQGIELQVACQGSV